MHKIGKDFSQPRVIATITQLSHSHGPGIDSECSIILKILQVTTAEGTTELTKHGVLHDTGLRKVIRNRTSMSALRRPTLPLVSTKLSLKIFRTLTSECPPRPAVV
jgi:hypothetical protein